MYVVSQADDKRVCVCVCVRKVSKSDGDDEIGK